MKKFVIAFVSLLLVVSMVVSCGEEKTPEEMVEYLEQWQVGGIVIPTDDYQLFTKLSILSQKTEEVFKAEITKKPDGIEVAKKENITFNKHYYDFYVKAKEDQVGIYPFEITLSSDNNTHVIKGEIEILAQTEKLDNLFGGANRSNVLTGFDFDGKDVVKNHSITDDLITGPVSDGNSIFIGTKDGDLIKLDSDLNEFSNINIIDASIDKIQICGDYIFIADVNGVAYIFEKSDTDNSSMKPISKLDLGSRLSVTPSVVSEKNLIVGTKGGAIISLAYPKLKKNWDYKTGGEVISLAASSGVSKKGDRKGTIVAACDDRNVYFVGLDGKLVTMESNVNDFVKHVSIKDGKVVLISETNKIFLRNLSDLLIYDMFTEKNIDSGAAFNGDYVVTVSRNNLNVHGIDDGYLQLEMQLDAEVVYDPIILDDKVLLFLEDGTFRVMDFMDGTEHCRHNFSGKPLGWPIIIDEKLVLMNEDGYISTWGERERVELSGAVDISSVKYFGGRGDLRHSGSFDFSVPENPSVILEIPGNFAPPIISNKYIFLYDMDREEFSLRSQEDGGIVWYIPEKAAHGLFTGAGLNAGPHESPMFITQDGLFIATESGLWLVDENTGEIIQKTNYIGIPQIDEQVIVLTSEAGVVCLDRNMNHLWTKSLIGVTSGQLCIDDDEIYVFDRNGDDSKIYVFEKLSGNTLFEETDSILQYGTKLVLSSKMAATGTIAGMWLMGREPYMVFGAVNGTNRALNPFVIDGVIGSMQEGIGLIKKIDSVRDFAEINYFDIRGIKDEDSVFYNFFTGNDFLTFDRLVSLTAKEELKANTDESIKPPPEVYVTIRKKINGEILSEIFVNSTGVADYAMTATDNLIAVCQQGPSPKLLLIGEK